MTYSLGSYGQGSGGSYGGLSSGPAMGAASVVGAAAMSSVSIVQIPSGSSQTAYTQNTAGPGGMGGGGNLPGGQPGIPGIFAEKPQNPIRGGAGVLSSGYGIRDNPTDPGHTQFHPGVDIAAPKGTPIYSPISGTIIESRTHEKMGNYVRIQSADGNVHTLMHLQSTFMAYEGAPVRQDAMIGFVGSTGNSTGPHVHWQINAANGSSVNPTSYLNN